MTNSATTRPVKVPSHFYCESCKAWTEQNLEQPSEDSAAICQACGDYYGCGECGRLIDRWGVDLTPCPAGSAACSVSEVGYHVFNTAGTCVWCKSAYPAEAIA